jgi:hypothetical protein
LNSHFWLHLSESLNRKHPLTLRMIRKLRAGWGISAKARINKPKKERRLQLIITRRS